MAEKRSTQPLRDALAAYDAAQPVRDEAWAAIDSEQDVKSCEQMDAAALHALRMAFYQLTSDRNSLDNALLADIEFIRRIAALDAI